MEIFMERALTFVMRLAALILVLIPSATATAAEETRTFALVVTNNRSSSLSMPDLQYADDDGARYYRLFRSVADADNVVLLTTFDRASAAAYPELLDVAKAPTKTAVESAARRIAAAVQSARKAGARTTFYFVYAGHGDVEQGRGTIDLEDGRVDGQFLERAIIETIPADTKHVLLDSCDSFFVLNPRKPGGRRWATPKDMALGFSKRHPEVGLFLSTNSDAEVFEWSELESGVFSHELRSGLSGAADVDGDGNVSYAEAAGFVDQANQRITRDNLRPHIYFRGPNGESTSPLFSPGKARGRRLVLGEGPVRLWVKSDRGERLLDLHKDQEPMTVVLPGPEVQAVSIYVEKQPAKEAGRPLVIERDAPVGDGEIRLASLTAAEPSLAARGDRLFGSIFALPYGRVAYASYVAAHAGQTEAVYGVSDTDILRMQNYIAAMADSDRQNRRFLGGALLGLGGALTATAIASYADTPRYGKGGTRGGAIAVASLGGLMIGGGVARLLIPTSGETALEIFKSEVASAQNKPVAFAKTEEALEDIARRDRRMRGFGFWYFEALGAGGITVTTLALAKPSWFGPPKLQPSDAAWLYSVSGLLAVAGFAVRYFGETPTERLLKLYRSDPGLGVQVGIAPTPSGGMVGVSGRF
jgi:hypothetical protein